MGGGSSSILQYSSKISIAKCLTGTENLCYGLKERNPNIVTVFRPLTKNCPDHETAKEWWDYVKPALAPNFDYYEVVNECLSSNYEVYAQWMIDVAQYALNDGKIILGFSFGPGNPELEDWRALYAYIQWADNHSLNGVHPGIALHESAFVPWPSSNWLSSPYFAGRHRLVQQYLKDYLHYDLIQFKGAVIVSESGLTDGYSGSWTDTFTCEQKALAYKETVYQYQRDGWVSLVWWNLGKVSIWTDDSECLSLMLN